ncbi:phage protein [Clostridium botulinum]|uniref:Phage protein n=1 Tax=Clostridium botulinum TaxID=1491 RepID=A0A9Q1UWF3_CLOBO|nr:type II toxin-antitoxin system HicB family antitoxin [Clostridium botulinum]AEB77256.1 phage protein [Clostridium botulinum BKT015925]KEH96257.1 hypothetical protein Y848_13275 [Clostridium botulinum C/D str. Sp77]KLU74357.1 phage protein [Clostridium botulinum V891]KOA72758.1 phage protein [Clostridium botulinum]KOA80430.1 phage protein [Clostridium botulinum]
MNMKKCTYVAILTQDLECGGYCITFPDFKGCITEGDDIADAYYMAHDALELHLTGMLEDGDEIPSPTDLKDIKLEKGQYTMIVQVEV